MAAMSRTLRCNIEDLASWHPWFFLEPHVVAFVAVGAHYGRPPAVFDVDCFNVESPWLGDAVRFRLEVSWSPETAERAERLRATVQTKPLVEMAATALALVIAHHVVRLGQLDVTNYGDRTDFRSTRISCMLEVSGTETRSELCAAIGRKSRKPCAIRLVGTPMLWSSPFRPRVIGFAFPFTICRSWPMTKRQARPYGERVKELMAEKSRLLSKAQTFVDMGLEETARPVWSCAASYEERIAPLLDVIGRDAEAALHRVQRRRLLREVR